MQTTVDYDMHHQQTKHTNINIKAMIQTTMRYSRKRITSTETDLITAFDSVIMSSKMRVDKAHGAVVQRETDANASFVALHKIKGCI